MDEPILKRDPNVIVAEVDGRPLLLNLVSWTYLSLNETGAAIWQHLETPLSRAALLRLLSHEFNAADAVLAADLDPFLEELREKGFLGHQ